MKPVDIACLQVQPRDNTWKCDGFHVEILDTSYRVRQKVDTGQ